MAFPSELCGNCKLLIKGPIVLKVRFPFFLDYKAGESIKTLNP